MLFETATRRQLLGQGFREEGDTMVREEGERLVYRRMNLQRYKLQNREPTPEMAVYIHENGISDPNGIFI